MTDVWLRRLEMRGQEEMAERVDLVLDRVYPVIYIVSLGVVRAVFF